MLVNHRWDSFWKCTTGRVDRIWNLGLLLVALGLFTTNLGGVALRDWDEGTVAQVAREISRTPFGWDWLYPTVHGVPYLNKPLLVHWVIALLYRAVGVSEWTARLPGALLTAISVPILYGVGRELFSRRTPAVLAALVYLTLLPVVRHGRLAMLDGAVLCFWLLCLLCLLRTRRDLRWGLGTGVAFGLLWLTKGLIALPLGAIALLFLWLDTPRLLRSVYLWVGLLLGMVPVAAWYGAQWWRYQQAFIQITLFNQSLDRVWVPIEANSGAPWYYLLEILKYSLPWLLFLPWGVRLAWQNRNLSWSKLVLVWAGGYLLIISLMSTKLPWYVLPFYPAMALIVGAYLATLWDGTDVLGGWRQQRRRIPLLISTGLTFIAMVVWVVAFYFSPLASHPQAELSTIFGAAAFTITVAAFLAACHDCQFIPILIWGSYITLLLFVANGPWVWELNESYPVKPVAQMVKQHTPPGTPVVTTYPYSRPSLNFYSDRSVIPYTPKLIQQHWQQNTQAYLLTNKTTLGTLKLEPSRQLAQSGNWILVSK